MERILEKYHYLVTFFIIYSAIFAYCSILNFSPLIFKGISKSFKHCITSSLLVNKSEFAKPLTNVFLLCIKAILIILKNNSSFFTSIGVFFLIFNFITSEVTSGSGIKERACALWPRITENRSY